MNLIMSLGGTLSQAARIVSLGMEHIDSESLQTPTSDD